MYASCCSSKESRNIKIISCIYNRINGDDVDGQFDYEYGNFKTDIK